MEESSVRIDPVETSRIHRFATRLETDMRRRGLRSGDRYLTPGELRRHCHLPPGVIFDDYQNLKIHLRDVTDGTSMTLMVSECDYDTLDDPAAEEWRANWGTTYCPPLPQACPIGKIWAGSDGSITTGWGINPGKPYAGYEDAAVQSSHPGVAQFLFVDGHVSPLSEMIDQQLLENLTTRAGGEVIDETGF